MKINLLLSGKPGDIGKTLIESFYKGLQRFSIECQITNKYSKCDFFVTHGIFKKFGSRFNDIHSIILRYQQDKIQNIILERGFINRRHYFMVGLNGLNGRAKFYNKNSPPDRWYKLKCGLGEWKIPNKINTVLFTSQVPDDSSVQHIDYIRWIKETITELLNRNKKIIFRYHPDVLISKANSHSFRWTIVKRLRAAIDSFKSEIEISNRNLYKDFQRSDILLTFNSNTSVDATIWGLPNICFDEGSMVYNYCGGGFTKLESPPIFNRRQWMCNICYSQWNLFEFKHGYPQKILKID